MRAWWLSVVAFVCALTPVESWAGDRLDAARKEAGSNSTPPSGGGGDGGAVVLGVLSLLADDDDHHHHQTRGSYGDDDDDTSLFEERRGFLPYPYADGRSGYMVRVPNDKPAPRDMRDVAVRIAAEGGYLYEDVWKTSGRLRLMAPRFYSELRYDFLLEGPQPALDGDLEVEGEVRDRLHFASFELGPQFFASEHFAVRFGLVGSLMADDQRSLPQEPSTTLGAGGVLGFDVYPVRPLVFSGRGAILKLGQTVMFEARGTVGVSLRRFEIYAGYDHRQVGDVHLGGPTAGVAVRF